MGASSCSASSSFSLAGLAPRLPTVTAANRGAAPRTMGWTEGPPAKCPCAGGRGEDQSSFPRAATTAATATSNEEAMRLKSRPGGKASHASSAPTDAPNSRTPNLFRGPPSSGLGRDEGNSSGVSSTISPKAPR
eukprot:CAMPEP_0183511774 /NCGR_PEP_ID=MMETSP0371-20130417/11119_1 /TAXON_ID=268820 /ORGANISM="Peridinium aciculiferum, Strain PAER-2" /LENGTH=133 /DNA_ID=CAMNT_0025708745 /DNA_START=16 /DNA_END=417 /DNA_ORIENTATION=+